MTTPIAILASGRGSNFDAILAATREGRLDARIVAVVSDRAPAPVLEKARAAGIPALHVASGEGRAAHERRVLEGLAPHGPRFLVLAGYMRLLSPVLLEAFRSPRGYSRITNIHPSLLPAFPGKDSYAQAWRHGAQVTGCTVHLVDDGLDSGPICAQRAFPIDDCASPAEVEARGLREEHRLYPETLAWVLPERFTIEKRAERTCVRTS
jgi:phosphoribosylglycinamide formyltransferase-1